jgi:hypothetical protein
VADVILRSAIISPCQRYRYSLTRDWSHLFPPDIPGRACFVMANPSTADALKDDATIRRCIGFARAWGFGGIEVVNLFAFRSKDPRELIAAADRGEDVIGPENDVYIGTAHNRGRCTVAAWGGLFSSFEPRVRAVRELLGDGLHYVGTLTKDGHPRHPRYLRGDLMPVVWRGVCGKTEEGRETRPEGA